MNIDLFDKIAHIGNYYLSIAEPEFLPPYFNSILDINNPSYVRMGGLILFFSDNGYTPSACILIDNNENILDGYSTRYDATHIWNSKNIRDYITVTSNG